MERRVDAKYSSVCDKAVAEMREHYHQKIVAAQPKPTIDDAVAPVVQERIINENGYTAEEQEAIDKTNQQHPSDETEEEVISSTVSESVNVFSEVSQDINWNYATEVKSRNSDRPYVIHVDEFTGQEKMYEQVEFSYYDEDEVVADARDQMLNNVNDVIGVENLKKFGHGSGNKYVVYVRNDKLNLDIEINKTEGSYAEIVQGHGIIEHSDTKRRRPNRKFDDDA
jgi:hypothetical protein